jgi:hypothetical protein
MLEGNSAGFNIDHLDGISITHCPEKGDPSLSSTGMVKFSWKDEYIKASSKAERRYLKTNKSERLEEILEELKKGMPSKVQE